MQHLYVRIPTLGYDPVEVWHTGNLIINNKGSSAYYIVMLMLFTGLRVKKHDLDGSNTHKSMNTDNQKKSSVMTTQFYIK